MSHGAAVEAKILFGGMVHDLACHVDSCLRIDAEGNIVGRNGGIKAWLADSAFHAMRGEPCHEWMAASHTANLDTLPDRGSSGTNKHLFRTRR